MDRLQSCNSPNRVIIEQRAGQDAEGVVFKEPTVSVYQLDNDRFWPENSERPDGLTVGQRGDNSWWVCFVELKHRALPEGFVKLLRQVHKLLELVTSEELEEVNRQLRWNIAQLNTQAQEQQDQEQIEHQCKLKEVEEQLTDFWSEIGEAQQQIDLTGAQVKAFGAQTKTLILRARHQLLSGVWHFMYHQKCHGGENAEPRYGDEHHQLWEQGHDLPHVMVEDDQGRKDHQVAAVVVLLQRSGSRSIAMLEKGTRLPNISGTLKLGGEAVCAPKPVLFRVLPTHLQSRNGQFVRIFKDMEDFLTECHL